MVKQNEVEFLDLSNSTASKGDLFAVVDQYKNLKQLRFTNVTHLDDITIFILLEQLKNLEELWIIDCPKVTHEEFPELVKDLKLKSLVVGTYDNVYCNPFGEDFPLQPRDPKLSHIKIVAKEFSPKSAKAFANNFPQLEKLDIACPSLCDDSVSVLSRELTHIKELTFDGTELLTIRSLVAIVVQCQLLTFASFSLREWSRGLKHRSVAIATIEDVAKLGLHDLVAIKTCSAKVLLVNKYCRINLKICCSDEQSAFPQHKMSRVSKMWKAICFN